MWLNSHILVCRCRRSSVTEIGEGREQAKMGGPTSLSCWHIQIPAGPCPSPPPALPQDTRILLLMLSPPFSPPSLLPSTSTTPGGGGCVCGVFICFSSARPSSAQMPAFVALLAQSCHRISNVLTWARCCCCFSLHPLPFTFPRWKKRAPNVTWGVRRAVCSPLGQLTPSSVQQHPDQCEGNISEECPMLGWGGARATLFPFRFAGNSPPSSQQFVCLGTSSTFASHSKVSNMQCGWRLLWNCSL